MVDTSVEGALDVPIADGLKYVRFCPISVDLLGPLPRNQSQFKDVNTRMQRRSSGVRLVAVVAIGLVLTACTSTETSETTERSGTLASGQSGIIGTLIATGGRAGTPEKKTSGQVLVWASSGEEPTTTLGAFPRPLEAVSTSGDFTIHLEPGWYLVKATETSGLSCGEVTVEVEASRATVVEFVCQHR